MADHGRIVFPGNPWPAGHRIKELVWSGRLDDRGLWFDLHLGSADYYEDDDRDDEELDNDWKSRVVWGNYHACTISSTQWHRNRGFQVGGPGKRFDLARLPGRRYHVDPLPRGKATVDDLDGDFFDDRPFNVYLLGHDTVADHRIRFAPGARRGELAIDWNGRIALTYVGHKEFKRAFRATIRSARFAGFTIEPGLPTDVAKDLLAVYTSDPRAYRLARGRFVPAAS